MLADCKKYRAIHKPNQIIYGTGMALIITGWTPKEAIAKQLQQEDYAAIGQLYSPTRGINFLIRNLIANPHIRYLIILDATKEDKNAGACQCLKDFFENGFDEGKSDAGKECWIIRSHFKGYIDSEVPSEVLEKLRKSVVAYYASSVDLAIEKVGTVKKFGSARAWAKPMEFPVLLSTPVVLPGPRYGHRIEGKTIAETWVKIIHRIKTTGTIRPTGYDGQWQELIDLMAIVTDEPPGFYFPEPNYLPVAPSFIDSYIPLMLEDKPSGTKYTYGQRLRSHFGVDQIEQVIAKLVEDPSAASAVMSLWDVKDHETGGSPCLNHVWVRIAGGELSLTATFRSNDMFSAWVANAMQLRSLQMYIFEEYVMRSQTVLDIGPLITISQSAHIYDDCFESADTIINTQYPLICKQRHYCDPFGNFLIGVTEGNIVVEQTTSGSGEIVRSFAGKTAKHLYREIALSCPALQTEHALYLGTELQKAEGALKAGSSYVQDAVICASGKLALV